ncbi:MAG: hypothetical protein AVDCRST_MAG20-1957, partial [uncultured Acidimicrobiales bacterium]
AARAPLGGLAQRLPAVGHRRPHRRRERGALRLLPDPHERRARRGHLRRVAGGAVPRHPQRLPLRERAPPRPAPPPRGRPGGPRGRRGGRAVGCPADGGRSRRGRLRPRRAERRGQPREGGRRRGPGPPAPPRGAEVGRRQQLRHRAGRGAGPARGARHLLRAPPGRLAAGGGAAV